jgi:hypothetical protein
MGAEQGEGIAPAGLVIPNDASAELGRGDSSTAPSAPPPSPSQCEKQGLDGAPSRDSSGEGEPQPPTMAAIDEHGGGSTGSGAVNGGAELLPPPPPPSMTMASKPRKQRSKLSAIMEPLSRQLGQPDLDLQ